MDHQKSQRKLQNDPKYDDLAEKNHSNDVDEKKHLESLEKADKIKQLMMSLNEEEIPESIKKEIKLLFESKFALPQEPGGKTQNNKALRSSTSKIDSQATTISSVEARGQNMGSRVSPIRTHINVSDFLKRSCEVVALFPTKARNNFVTPTKKSHMLLRTSNKSDTSNINLETALLSEKGNSYKNVIGKIFHDELDGRKKAPFFNKKTMTKRENSEESININSKKQSSPSIKVTSPKSTKRRKLINKSVDFHPKRQRNKSSFFLEGASKIDEIYDMVNLVRTKRTSLNKSMTELRQSLVKRQKEKDSSFVRKSLILNESAHIEKNSKRRKKSEGSMIRAIDKLKKDIKTISQEVQFLKTSNQEAAKKINSEQSYINEMRFLIKETKLQIKKQKESNTMLKDKLKAGKKFLKILLQKEEKMNNLNYIVTLDDQLKNFYDNVKQK